MKYLFCFILVPLSTLIPAFSQIPNNHVDLEYVNIPTSLGDNTNSFWIINGNYNATYRASYSHALKGVSPMGRIETTFISVGLSYQSFDFVDITTSNFNPNDSITFSQIGGTEVTQEAISFDRLTEVGQESIYSLDLGFSFITGNSKKLKVEGSSGLSLGISRKGTSEYFSRSFTRSSEPVILNVQNGQNSTLILQPVSISSPQTQIAGPAENPKKTGYMTKIINQIGLRYDFGKEQLFGIRIFLESRFSYHITTNRNVLFGYAGKIGLGTSLRI